MPIKTCIKIFAFFNNKFQPTRLSLQLESQPSLKSSLQLPIYYATTQHQEKFLNKLEIYIFKYIIH